MSAFKKLVPLECHLRLFKKALEVDDSLKQQEEEIMAINMQGIVDGFSRESFACSLKCYHDMHMHACMYL